MEFLKNLSFILLSSFLLFIVGCGDSENPTANPDPDPDPDPIVGDPGKASDSCYPAFEEDELNVATWNIKNFPQGSSTVGKVEDIIEDLDADIVAIQEIADTDEFTSLGENLENWTAVFSDVRHGQELGFLYKESAFNSFSDPIQLFDDDSYAFPRQAVLVTVEHISGLEVTLINIHLKCCGVDGSDEQQRREAASVKLEEYINENLADKSVILLGDFNDDIGVDFVTPFQNFIDSEDYVFVDQAIADGDDGDWSFPSWPSHLDHILISNELFDKVRGVETIIPNDCVVSYSSSVSDHRPVLASFK